MPISNLSIDHIRNISSLYNLPLSTDINILIGNNGSGKTSFLESIYLLLTGRSFRTQNFKKVMQYQKMQCSVAADVTSLTSKSCNRIGFSRKSDGRVTARIGANEYQAITPLTRLVPIQYYTPDRVLLIDASSDDRRRFLDWGLFHVEHDFQELWLKTRKLLKQRNALLKSNQLRGYQDLEPWDIQLSACFNQINALRKTHLAELIAIVETGPFSEVFSGLNIKMKYYQGWKDGESLETLLKEAYDSDRLKGFTHLGCHRADLRFHTADGIGARDSLSRGQKKLITLQLKMLQTYLISKKLDKQTIFLFDDISAELDTENIKKILNWLMTFNVQLFATALMKGQVEFGSTERSIKMFHVEHGRVLEK